MTGYLPEVTGDYFIGINPTCYLTYGLGFALSTSFLRVFSDILAFVVLSMKHLNLNTMEGVLFSF